MRVRQAFGEGIRKAGRLKSMALLLYGVNLIFGLAVILPAAPLISNGLAHSRYADHLMGGFDLAWLSELYHQFPALPRILFVSLLVGGILYLLLNVFMTGGLLSVLESRQERVSLKVFFGGCGEYFLPLLRVFLFSLPVYFLVAVFYLAVGRFWSFWFRDSTEAWPVLITGWIRILVMLALVAVVTMIFDYVRIRLVTGGERRAFFALRKVVVWVGGNLRKTLMLDLSFLLLAVFLYVVYHLLSELPPQSSVLAVAVAILLQQGYLVSRAWTRIAFYAGERALYRELIPAGVVSPVEEAEPPAPEAGESVQTGAPAESFETPETPPVESGR
ncbi:MAG: hypothetical protein ACE5JX_09890 [Acidobacteriota bacterium]